LRSNVKVPWRSLRYVTHQNLIVQDFDFYIIFLFQGTKNTIEYFLKIIYKLKPLENDVLAQIYEKLLSKQKNNVEIKILNNQIL
jgi:hypothetical protein